MRPYHILAALGATTTINLAQAQDTKPNPDQVGAQATQASTDCTSSPTTTWSLPSTSASTTNTANFTVTLVDSPANGTAPTTTDGSLTMTISTEGPVTATSPSSPGAASSSSSSAAAAAAAGEGLSSDSSMLGLVIFFALSLCLL